MKKLLKFTFLFVLLTSCNAYEAEDFLTENKQGTEPANPYRVTLKEALDNANEMLIAIDGNATRTSSRMVESVDILGSKVTRGTACDTLLYLVNYKDEQGFALLSADSRYAPIFAISESGSLNMSDTIYNEGLAIFLRQTRESMEAFPFIPGDSVWVDPGIDLRPTVPVVDITVHPSLLNPNVALWHQNSPFNYYTPYVLNLQSERVHAPVGCVPLSTAMIMS